MGALVLGRSIKKTATRHVLVCLHTADVPDHSVSLLRQLWDCRLVQHVNAVPQLSTADLAHRFAKVFTKLRVLELVEFSKVLLLDIDLLVMSNVDDLFELQPPAAMRRGMNESKWYRHGDSLDGRHFFSGASTEHGAEQFVNSWSWGQGTGINAGVMLLQPDLEVFRMMCSEIEQPNHPEHIRAHGPEQDYLSRFYADVPWTHIGVENNFQLHQMFFALQPDRARCERAELLRATDRIRIVHFSGTAIAKPWQRILHEQFLKYWPDRGLDDEYIRAFAGEFAGYWLWVVRDRASWTARETNKGPKGRLDLDTEGMFLGVDGHIYRHGDHLPVDIPKEITNGAMDFLSFVLALWFDMFEELQREMNVDLQLLLTPPSRSANTSGTARSAKGWNAGGFHSRSSTQGTDKVSQWTDKKANKTVHDGRDVPFLRGKSEWSIGGGARGWRWRRRDPSNWWVEELGDASSRSAAFSTIGLSSSKVTILCSCVDGRRLVRFVEAGVCTFEEEGAEISGVFAKAVGPHCGRHWSCAVDEGLDEVMAALRLWVQCFPSNAFLLLALVDVPTEFLRHILSTLAPLGTPQTIPAQEPASALAVVCAPRGGVVASSSSEDFAYVSVPLHIAM